MRRPQDVSDAETSTVHSHSNCAYIYDKIKYYAAYFYESQDFL